MDDVAVGHDGNPSAGEFLRSVEAGARVVARYRIPGGFTDALGYVQDLDGHDRSVNCPILTRRGLIPVPLATVVAAKRVPEPPTRRNSAGPPLA